MVQYREKMKLKPLHTLLLLLLPFSAMSAEGKSSVYAGISESKKIKDDGTEGGALQVMLSIPGVDAQYEACKKLNLPLESISECLWSGSGNVPALKDDLKKKVTEAYNQQNAAKPDSGGRSPASTNSTSGNGLTTKSKNISIDYMSDPAVQALSKVFEKKLEEALLGDENARKDTKTVAAVDHSKFIDLYKTELGKSIVNSFTAYCLETSSYSVSTTTQDCTDEDGNKTTCELYLLSSDATTAKRDNIKSLKGVNLASDSKSAPNRDSKRWTSCITSVSKICYMPQSNITNAGASTYDYDKSHTRACEIMDFVKTARKSLIIADEQRDFYDKLGNGATMALMKTRNVEATDKINPDMATTVTSKEIEDSYEKKNKEVVEKEMADCYDEKTQQIKNAEACKKFIETNPEEKKKALAEFALRQNALGQNLEEKLKDDNEVKKYLKEEGYDDKKIGEMTKNATDIEKIRQEIKDRFANEREALIKSMAAKIEKKTTTNDGINAQNDATKIGKIKDEIAQRPDDLKQLVHFSNIVSSYLEIDTGGKKTRNVASLYAEVNSSASNMPSVDKNQTETIKKNAESAGLKPKKDNLGAGTDLNVDVLNKILKYINEK